MKKEIKNKQSGITLVALVITVIVMLILAGVSISMLFGENGILKNTEKAGEETLIKGYEEKIRLATTEGNSNALIEPEKYENEEDILDDIGDIIKKDSQFEEAKIYKIGSGTEDVKLVVVTKEGYVFYVEVDKTEYAGTKEDIGDITVDTEIQKGDITYICDPTDWTNGKVEVTLKQKDETYDIEYSYDAKTWNKYEEGQTITVTDNNTAIYTRLRSDNTVLKGYATGNITNIDRLEPNEFTPTAESTTNSITVKAEVADQEATEIDGSSGIAGYRFSIDNGTTWTEYQESGEHTWNDLTQTTDYTIIVEVKDKAGNTKTGTTTKGTGTIETTSGAITFGNLSWGNNKASVTVTKNTADSLTIEYKINDGSYISIASGGIISNLNLGDVVTVRLTDGINYGSTASLTVTDTTAPNSATITLNSTTTDTESSVTATVTQSDSQSGVNITSCRWVYNKISGNIGTNTSSYTGGTFSSNGQKLTLKNSTVGTYYLHVLTIDKAGNKKETVSKAVTITKAITYQAFEIGDQIYVGGERFYVLEESDKYTKTVTLITKYVLNNYTGTGQDSWAVGGCVFSSTNYWSSDFTSSPFNLNNLGKESTGDAIAKAKSYATSKGGINGRLLTYEEALSLKDNYGEMIWGDESSINGYLRYWLGSAHDEGRLWTVDGRDKRFSYMDTYKNDLYCGVRPVITVYK